jgi:hypothetical protein
VHDNGFGHPFAIQSKRSSVYPYAEPLGRNGSSEARTRVSIQNILKKSRLRQTPPKHGLFVMAAHWESARDRRPESAHLPTWVPSTLGIERYWLTLAVNENVSSGGSSSQVRW